MRKKRYIISLALLCLLLSMILFFPRLSNSGEAVFKGLGNKATLTESGAESESTSPSWWLDSGGYFFVENGVGRTNFGSLPPDDEWSKLYAKNSPVDTDKGTHPQNLFRLILRDAWQDVFEEAYFNIDYYNVSKSPNRNGTNGILLMSRYRDSDNLYYGGLRVDGTAVIKKKIGGVYTTLGETKIFPGTYDHDNAPNLIPEREWIGLKTETVNVPPDAVRVRLYVDLNNTGEWKMVLESLDQGERSPVTEASHTGIRTDFMDVYIKDYKVGNAS